MNWPEMPCYIYSKGNFLVKNLLKTFVECSQKSVSWGIIWSSKNVVIIINVPQHFQVMLLHLYLAVSSWEINNKHMNQTSEMGIMGCNWSEWIGFFFSSELMSMTWFPPPPRSGKFIHQFQQSSPYSRQSAQVQDGSKDSQIVKV